MKIIEINENIYKKNKVIAYSLKDRLHEKNIKMINLLGSPALRKQFYKDAKCLNPKVKIFEVSATRGDGVNKICNLIGG
ncbi:hypothetical protein WBZ18_02935 [Clostridium botulinum]|uniref:hypothetical protein n=1 Tax=Clostridium botulinum TaxID=1491 RepID=UPI000585FC34|nr:hypothetical protein [Clostridium botulinum]AJD28836.1 putative hydrogenase accessory protein HypB [Clostridium botulinum CDC_297]APR02231.1 putative hydrogenase accessory protein HypB [Clostridium botulinum]APU61107.1 putative hydrogenase accessory protein HypB [Clostridium botulinum]AUN03712.1 hypothetical protein RSJ19_12665 [Clostridium botulinum]MBN3397547.1 hypothetical protein [Clostridium botulinum]